MLKTLFNVINLFNFSNIENLTYQLTINKSVIWVENIERDETDAFLYRTSSPKVYNMGRHKFDYNIALQVPRNSEPIRGVSF